MEDLSLQEGHEGSTGPASRLATRHRPARILPSGGATINDGSASDCHVRCEGGTTMGDTNPKKGKKPKKPKPAAQPKG